MTSGTSQGLFLVVAIVIFGIFVGLTYTVFGSEGLTNDLENIFTNAINTTKNYTESNFFTFDKKTGTIIAYDAVNGPKDVVVPEMIEGVKVINITNTAFSDIGLNSLILQENLENLINGTFENGSDESGNPVIINRTGAFYNNNLTEIILPKSMKNIGQRAFMFNKLTEIDIPDNVNTLQQGAFKGNKLNTVTIGKGVYTIGANVFEDNELTELYIPTNVKSLGSDFILGNENLKTLYVPRHLESEINKSFRIAHITHNTGTLVSTYPEIVYYD